MKLKICCLLLFFRIGLCHAQEPAGLQKIDSILQLIPQAKTDSAKINQLLEVAKAFKSVDPTKGIQYGKQALEFSKSIQWHDGIAKSLLVIGQNNYNIGEIDAAKKNYLQALNETQNQSIVATLYKSIGALHTSNADYANGLAYHFKSLKVSTAIQNEVGMADAYYSIGTVYHYMEDTEKSLSNFKKSLSIYTKLNQKAGICASFRAIAAVYMFLNRHQEAMSYLEKSLKIAKEINNLELQSSISFAIGKSLLEQNQYEQAIPYCIDARQNAATIKHIRLMCTTQLLEANAYVAKVSAAKTIDRSLLQKAYTLVKQSIGIAKKTKNVVVLSQCYKTLSDIYSLRSEHKSAKETYILYTNLQDSIYSEDSRQTIENLENKRTIDLKNKQIEIAKLTMQSNEQQKWFYIIGMVFLTILGVLLFVQNRMRSKTNRKLSVLNMELDDANKTKARFFSILNHDLRSPVANLIAFLQIKKQNPGLLDEEVKLQMENKTLTAAENLLVSMEDILFWSKSQMENFQPQPEKVDLDLVFSDLAKHFSDVGNINLVFENLADIVIFTDENYLKTILRNLTANAVKALVNTQNPKIILKAWHDNETDFISVTDNGPGVKEEQFRALYDEKEVVGIQSGLGLHLIRDLAKVIDCKISVESIPASGTTFTLSFQ